MSRKRSHTRSHRICVIPDTHRPDHDPLALATALAGIKHAAPDEIVIIGDFADYYAISRHMKDATRETLFVDEIEDVNRGLDAIEKIAGENVTYCEGNHEERLQRYVDERCPELAGVLPTSEDLFRIKRRGWKWVPYRSHTRIGRIYFAHDVGPCGKHGTVNTLSEFQHPIVVGHSHRAGVAYGGSIAGDRHVAMSVGWLGDVRKARYAHDSKKRDWQHAFGDVWLDSTGAAWCNVIPIISGRCMVDGKVVSGRVKR